MRVLFRFSSDLLLLLLAIHVMIGCSKKYPGGNDKVSVFHGDIQHTGVYDVKPIRSNVQVTWAFKTEGPIRGAAVQLNGVIYFGSGDRHLYAVDKNTGNKLWSFETGGAVHSTPMATDNLIAFTSRDKFIYALHPKDGTELWRVETGEILPLEWEFDYYLSSAILAQNSIYVGAGDGFVYALNPFDGSVKWKSQTNGRVRTSPAYSEGIIYIGNMNGQFYAFDAETGDLIWNFKVEGLESNFLEYGFDRASILGAAAVTNDLIIFGSRDANVYALDKKTGEVRWKVSQRGTSWAITSPAVVDSVIYMGTSDALFVQALHLETGNEIWRADSLGANWPSPVVAGDVLYSGSYREEIFALNRFTGEKMWAFNTGFANLATGLPDDSLLYTGSDDGFFYALAGSPDSAGPKKEVLRAVHWEYRNARSYHDRIKDYLVEREYELLDSSEVAQFISDRIADRSLSVIVMAVNLYPGKLLKKSEGSNSQLREYLNIGGKVVWLGTRHLIRTRDAKVLQEYENLSSEILDIDYRNDLRGVKGFMGNNTTPKGYAWGLRTAWWIGCCGVNINQVNTILAKDEYGNASAWVKNYGGPNGTGYVRLEGSADVIKDFKTIIDVAEYGF